MAVFWFSSSVGIAPGRSAQTTHLCTLSLSLTDGDHDETTAMMMMVMMMVMMVVMMVVVMVVIRWWW